MSDRKQRKKKSIHKTINIIHSRAAWLFCPGCIYLISVCADKFRQHVHTSSSWVHLSQGSVVWKIWLFAPNLNATLSLVLFIPVEFCIEDRNLPLSCAAWLGYSSGSPVVSPKYKACSTSPTSHSSSTAGCLTKLMVTPEPVSPLQNLSFVHTLLQSHPCCPAPYYKCQRILIWLRVTKSSLRQLPL